jgi:hypothetical protein
MFTSAVATVELEAATGATPYPPQFWQEFRFCKSREFGCEVPASETWKHHKQVGKQEDWQEIRLNPKGKVIACSPVVGCIGAVTCTKL